MTERKELWAALIVAVAVTAVIVYAAVHALAEVAVIQAENANAADAANTLTGVSTAGWQTYADSRYGFSLQYPQNWQLSTAGLSAETPFIALGNPLSGTTTYVIYVSIEQNPHVLSPGDFVHQMLADARAADAASGAASGTAPAVTPRFTGAYLTTVGQNGAYELSGVFEFDHDAEQIYVTNDAVALKFDFPVADANPNLASPANNNAIAHKIIDTLTFE